MSRLSVLKFVVPSLLLLSQSCAFAFSLNGFKIFNQCFYASHMDSSLPDKKVVLTFDDGPNSQTERLLTVLKELDVKATFFVLGRRALNSQPLLKQIWGDGHIIANHSYSHESFHNLRKSGVRDEIFKTDRILAPFMKEKFFRYPYGNSTCAAEEALNEAGYIKVGWQVDTCDYAFADGKITDAEATQCGISNQNRNDFLSHALSLIERKKGGIVLFHDIHAKTVDSIAPLVMELKNRGYQFVNLDDRDVLPLLKSKSRIAN